jgi:AraC-like DNA-binding protein
MGFTEISPENRLKPYIKCYYIYESDSDVTFEDTVFPSGCLEIIFNLGTGQWQTSVEDEYVTNPAIELWGQIIKPLPVRSTISAFNDQVVDFRQVADSSVSHLHDQLLHTSGWKKRIALIETFLLQRFSLSEKKHNKVLVVSDIMKEISHPDFFDNIENVASRYGFTSRYLQKLFLQYTGLTPKLYSKINRFQNSLKLVTQKDASLTSIAYDCGYFDQSHFIREFKAFTGYTPSGYMVDSSPITVAFANN